MKRVFKVILWTVGVLVVAIVAILFVFKSKITKETSIMTPIETKQVVDNVHAVYESYSNMYLIEDGGKYIAIDAGNKIEDVKEELKKLEVNPNDVVAVFLTHSDGDHVGSLSLYNNAKVYLSKEEEQLLTGETSRFLFIGNKLDVDSYNLLDDSEELKIGSTTIKAIHTPGHTPGSMSYLVNNKYLFTGDGFSIENCRIAQFNEFFNMDTETAMKSLDKIKGQDSTQYIFTAHYGYCDNYEEAMNSIQ